MTRVIAALIVGLTMFAHPSTAYAKWTRLSSEHFVFVGDAAERDIRNIALRLEQFHDVIGRLFPNRLSNPSIQTVVVVFENDRTFTPFKPMFEGKPISVAGYFTGNGETNYIAVNAEQDSAAYGVIFHEYAHFLVHNALGSVPLWADEGLAGFYETFESRGGGKSAMLGMPNVDNVRLLQATTTLLPLQELMAVAHDSPLYNEGERRGLFYAESWALVHYLTLGSPERSGQFQRFLSSVVQGADGREAFQQAFGADTAALEQELQRYARRLLMNALQLDFPDKGVTVTARGETIPDRAVAGYLGELIDCLGRRDDATAYLQKAIEGGGDAAGAMAALGTLELRAGHDDEALAVLERAMSLAPEVASVQRAYGWALWQRGQKNFMETEALRPRAQAALARALELEPGNAATAVALAQVEMSTPSGAVHATTLLQEVVKAVPGREDYRLLLAQAFYAQHDYRGASNTLGPLVAYASRPELKAAARMLLTRVANDMNAARPAATPSGRQDTAAVPASASSAGQPSGPRRDATLPGGYIPALRTVGAGETRLLGVFSAVDCRPGAIVLQIDTPGGSVPLAVVRFEEVEFLTYRPDAPGGVACGPQNPAYRVFATFRTDETLLAGAGTNKRAVAIELLPDNYVAK
jgi:tetratricopeptide (TPR) repeat protein